MSRSADVDRLADGTIDAIRDREAFLSLAEESAGIGIWDHELASGLVRGTPQFFRIMGLPASAVPIPQETIRALRHPEDRERVLEGYRRAQALGIDSYEAEYRIIRPDGQLRWIFGRGRTIRDQAGTPVRYYGVDIDITERKRAEAALRASEERLRVAQDSASIAIFELDLAAGRTLWSAALRKLFGIGEVAPPPSGGYVDLVHPDNRQGHEAEWARALAAAAGHFQFVIRLLPVDGETRWLELRGGIHRDPSGNPTRALGVAIDITRRKLVEQQLRESELRFATAFHSAAHPMTISTVAEGRYLDVNAAALAASGMRREEMVGHTTRDLGFYEDPGRFALVRDLLARDGQFTNLETNLVGRTGRKTFLLSGARVELGGEPCLLVSAIDITARKQIEEALRVSEARLEISVRAAGLGILDLDHRTGAAYWSPELRALCGWKQNGEPGSQSYLECVHSEDRAAVEGAFRRAREIDSNGAISIDHRLQLGDGNVRFVSVRLQAFFEPGSPVAIRTIGAVLDITSSRQAEEHIRFLMHEMHHRSNNLLSVVQAVAQQTARHSDPRIFADLLGKRIAALSASHSLLVSSEWHGAPILDLVRSQLSHFGDLLGTRILTEGPPVRLVSGAVRAIGMALHELATNAGKYGALSGSQGRVRIGWRADRDSALREFRLHWIEEGGPQVDPPDRKGFGHTVMVGMVQGTLGGSANLEFRKEGVRWEISCPLDNVVDSR